MTIRTALAASMLGFILISCSSDTEAPGPATQAAGNAGSSGSQDGGAGTGGQAGAAGAAGAQDAGQGGTDASAGGSGGAAGDAGQDSGAAGQGGGNAGADGGDATTSALDPRNPGPFTTQELDDTALAQGDSVAIHCVYPTSGPIAPPYPVVIVGHGMQLPASQYYGYVKALAGFGYVALTVDFPTSLVSVDNPKAAKQLLAGLDWAGSKSALQADANRAGMTGHSLGGKLALLAATLDPRVKASITLDPVDGSGLSSCNPPGCVDVSALLPSLAIPTGFLGETLDGQGGFQPCAPAADNFLTFYANAKAPSLAATVNGANHMSFLDDVATCGFVCLPCNQATLANNVVRDLSHAYVVAFYERYLRQNTTYDTWLTGAQAQAAWIGPGLITVTSK